MLIEGKKNYKKKFRKLRKKKDLFYGITQILGNDLTYFDDDIYFFI